MSYPYASQQGKGADPYAGSYGYYGDAAGAPKAKGKPMDNTEIRTALASLDKQIHNIKSPQGTKDNPARTCKDLFLCNTEFEDGYYYIDPNQGCTADAIRVRCIKKSNESCLEPKTMTYPKKQWYTGPAKSVYMSSFDEIIEYNMADLSQLTFLRLLTTTVSQKVTYLCKDSTADIKLLTSVEIELTRNSEEVKNQFNVISDGCAVKDGQWHETQVSYSTTTRSSRLPIIDVAAGDIGASGQKFGWEIGAVCFV